MSRPVSFRRKRLVALGVALMLIAAACNNSSSDGGGSTDKTTGSSTPGSGSTPTAKSDFNQAQIEGTPKEGGSIVVGVESTIASLDPAGALAQPSDVDTALAIYDPLITFSKGKYAPVLATKWVNSPDLKTWTLTLRDGVKFSDGTPFNADAVVKQFTRLKDPATNCVCAPNVEPITSVKATDASTVVFTLDKPNAFFMSLLAGGVGYIASPTATAKWGKDYSRHPVGTGPFVLQSYDSLVLKKNPDYWMKDDKGRQLPYLDQITVKPIPDATVRLQTLKAGGVDVLQTADTGTIVDAVKDGSFKLQKVTGSSATIILFNFKKPPFNDVIMRRAVAESINRAELNNTLYKGSRQESYSAFATDSPFYDPAALSPKFDLKDSKKLVAQAKAKGDPTTFTATCIATPEGRQGLSITQQQGKAVGLNSQTEFLDQGAYVNKVLGPNHDFTTGCFRSPQIADADGLYASLHTGGASNVMGYSNPAVDKALDDIRATTDQKEHIRLLKIVQEQTAKDIPIIPLLYDLFANIYNPKVSGLPVPQANSLGAIRFTTLYLKQ